MNEYNKPGPKPSPEAAKRVKFTTKLDNRLLTRFKNFVNSQGLKANEVLEELIKQYLKK